MEHDRSADVKGLTHDNLAVPPIGYGRAHEGNGSALDREVADAQAIAINLERRDGAGSRCS
jgi:hypothetical protein